MYVCARQNEDKESLVSYASQVRGSAARRLTPEFSAKEDLSAVYHSVFLLSLSFSLCMYVLLSFSFFFDSPFFSASFVFFRPRECVCARRVLSVIYGYKVKGEELAS